MAKQLHLYLYMYIHSTVNLSPCQHAKTFTLESLSPHSSSPYPFPFPFPYIFNLHCFFWAVMSLSCLSCQKLQRVDSDKEYSQSYEHERANYKLHLTPVERSWSGNLGRPRPQPPSRPHNKIITNDHSLPAVKEVNTSRHRYHNSAPIEFDSGTPRLVRCPGMRRDWSFEDLRQARDGKIKN